MINLTSSLKADPGHVGTGTQHHGHMPLGIGDDHKKLTNAHSRAEVPDRPSASILPRPWALHK